ncbi:MAG: DUF1934 domain-containing protein [Lachnospiraceae bacterium]|jgi:uncharacterized beta-barrel protein YwiB (DUF1934 family)|nr:DUF1934 domain-containing protein [Lachnospiraceae bacterium]
MTKDVLLFIKGLQFESGNDAGDLETVTAAEYYKKNNHHYVIYEEAMEGFRDTTKNIIKWNGETLDLTKRGLINVHMIFEEKKKNVTDYKTPFGSILIGIDTRQISVEEAEEQIRVNVDYALEINYEHLADCQITMDVRARDCS